MKKLFILLSLACMGLVVSSCYDDSELWESVNGLESRVKTLETLCSEMNTNISSLQDLAAAVQKGGYITEVTPLTENGVEVGYKVTLNDGRMVTIYHGKNGSAGNAPQIGVKQDSDGKYYWVVGGEWIKDDKGNKVPVSSGTTPKIKVENGKWCVSYDGGTTWEELGAATASDTCLFDDVTYTNGVLTLKFADGNVLSFPIGDTFRIVLGDFDINVGKNLEIPYTIQGATGEVMVFAVADNVYDDAEIMVKGIVEETAYSGKIKVRVSWEDREYTGKVAIFAVDEAGTTVSKVLRLTTGVMHIDEDTKYVVENEASSFSITLSTNRSYNVSTNEDWIKYVETKAVEEKTLVFEVEENEGFYRNAEVYITSGEKTITVPVYQKTSDDYVFSVKKKVDINGHGNLSIYVGGDDPNVITNSKGQTVAEALGYSSWEELRAAVGDWDTMRYFDGDVVVTAYNPLTGESFGFKEYNSRYNYDGPGYRLDNYGKISDYSYEYYHQVFDWDVDYDSYYLEPYFNIYLNDKYVLPGETYICGVMLTSKTAEVRIEVTVEFESYTDPELGMYDDPAEPGEYTFEINEQFEIQAIPSDGYRAKTYKRNSDVYEIIKSTLGMTSYELYRIRNDVGEYFVFTDYDYYSDSYFNLDISGNTPLYYSSDRYEERILEVSNTVLELNTQDNYLNLYVPYGNGTWTSPVIAAAEKGAKLKFKYVFRYDDYELQFNINVKYVEVKSDDPEAGRYDEAAVPGTYEFDVYDKVKISVPEYEFNSVLNETVYEKVKETLGMTSYEISKVSSKIKSYYLLDDDVTLDDSYCYFDESGDRCWSDDYVVSVEWRMFSPISANNFINLRVPYYWDLTWDLTWPDYVIAAAEAGLKVRYKYVIEYGEYKLIFNHTIEFEKTEYDDPEEGLYDDPAAPGRYEFDLTDEYLISASDAGKDSQTFDSMAYKPNTDAWTIIRQTLGMTSSELYGARNNVQRYYILDDGSQVNENQVAFGIDGKQTTWGASNYLYGCAHYYCSSHLESNNYRWVSAGWSYDPVLQGNDWYDSVYEAAEKGTVINYKYVVEYEGYTLVFNHKIKFTKN